MADLRLISASPSSRPIVASRYQSIGPDQISPASLWISPASTTAHFTPASSHFTPPGGKSQPEHGSFHSPTMYSHTHTHTPFSSSLWRSSQWSCVRGFPSGDLVDSITNRDRAAVFPRLGLNVLSSHAPKPGCGAEEKPLAIIVH